MTRRRPGPILAAVLRAPARLYDWNVGWVLGRRFLRLTHVGRRTGRQYRTVLEVVGEKRDRDEVIVVAGLGRSAQWYRNLLANKATEVAIGRERFAPRYRELDPVEAAAVLAEYERRNRYIAPLVRRVLSWLVGWHYDGTPGQRLALARELPIVALRPLERTAGSS
ncbi:MAG TPA: nitroreductase family deazaflavin-dependent oxidoreductase [Solirubrobacteraceae bacterium]|nr:nitroreductase family deazaflavin-dependent oxidoreductase [Solirubrobacteraceae bacterium]